MCAHGLGEGVSSVHSRANRPCAGVTSWRAGAHHLDDNCEGSSQKENVQTVMLNETKPMVAHAEPSFPGKTECKGARAAGKGRHRTALVLRWRESEPIVFL